MPSYVRRLAFVVLVSALVAGACGAPQRAQQAPAGETTQECTSPDKVRLQLQWVVQSQFAGFYAAEDQGFYKEECLEVTIQPGGPDIFPQQVVAGRGAEFGVSWLPKVLVAREEGANIVNIAQHFNYSGMLEITWKDSGLDTVSALKGKKVATWLGGNELELYATLKKHGLDPEKDVEIVSQPFDMNLFLDREVDAAAAMIYNEYRQVLAAGHEAEELNVIDFNKEGTAMLQDGIFVLEDWLNEGNHKDVAARFVRASMQGWTFCRDNPDGCVDIVMKNGPTLDRDHMAWMMEHINGLIWPLPDDSKGIGHMVPRLFEQTVEVGKEAGLLKQDHEQAYTHAVWEAAGISR